MKNFAGSITITESEELIRIVPQFASTVEAWIGQHYPGSHLTVLADRKRNRE